jgi:hypothetical protein
MRDRYPSSSMPFRYASGKVRRSVEGDAPTKLIETASSSRAGGEWSQATTDQRDEVSAGPGRAGSGDVQGYVSRLMMQSPRCWKRWFPVHTRTRGAFQPERFPAHMEFTFRA